MKTITSIKAIIFICVLSSVLLLTACSKSSDPTPAAEVQPTVTTSAVTSITSTTAVFGGNVTDLGNQTINARGVVYSRNANPTISDYFVGASGGSGLGPYITGTNPLPLTPNTLYHVRAIIQTNTGFSYGNDVTFTTLP